MTINSLKIGCVAGLLGCLLFATGCGGDKPAPAPGKESKAKPTAKSKEALALEQAKPAGTFDAAAWKEQWKDGKAAGKKYGDQVVEVSGEVDSLNRDPNNKVGIITLKVEKSLLGVMCNLIDNMEPWTNLSPGVKVRVRGKVPAGADGSLYPCVIVEQGTNTALNVTASDLAKEVKGDPRAASAKYNDKYVLVTGVVKANTLTMFDNSVVTLEENDGVAVKCNMDKDEGKRVKVGDSVKVFGRASIGSAQPPKEVEVNQALFVTGK